MNKNFSNYIVVEIPNKNKYTKLPLCTKVDKKNCLYPKCMSLVDNKYCNRSWGTC